MEEHRGAALLRRDTHRMSLTQTGQLLLADAQTILAYAEAATQRLWEDQTTMCALISPAPADDGGNTKGESTRK